MKTLTKKVILERNHVAMVMKERNLLARLHCPQMVNMHYAFQDDANLYIIMDVCLGGDLHYQLTHSPGRCFTEDQARFYVASIILCLDYMHGVGVMHRDIKPENLLLDSRGQLKVSHAAPMGRAGGGGGESVACVHRGAGLGTAASRFAAPVRARASRAHAGLHSATVCRTHLCPPPRRCHAGDRPGHQHGGGERQLQLHLWHAVRLP
jgi:serine/threonine protein kinase